MASFKDRGGDTWEVPFTLRQVLRIKSALGLDLAEIAANKDAAGELGKLAGNLAQMVDVLFLCCEPQAKERGVSDEQFAERMDLDVFGKALDCFLEAYLDFFLSGPTRDRARGILAKRRLLATARIDQQREAAVDALGAWSDSASDSPPSPGSGTPDPSPSGKSTGRPKPGSGTTGRGRRR